MSRSRIQTIPVPRPDLNALTNSLVAVKQHIESTNGSNTVNAENAYVSVRDLLTLGVVVVDENGVQRQLIRSDLAKLALIRRHSDPA